jgi:sulfite exporter TauE/SafE
MIGQLTAGFAIGFLGSLHCVGMCGGLIGAMTMTRSKPWWPGIFAYQFGRITTYTALGLITGLIGSLFASASWAGNAQRVLSIMAGLLIIILALHIGGWLPDPFSRLSKTVANATGLSRWLGAAASGDTIGPWYSVGLINGLLPCGLVYAGIGLSLTADSPLHGAVVMFCFGLGTVPAMLAAPALLRTITPAIRGRVLKFGAVLLIAIGILTVVRGTTLVGHQHAVDMKTMSIHETASCCQIKSMTNLNS